MRTPKILLAAATVSISFMSTASFAADLGMPLPPPQLYSPQLPPPPPVQNCCDDFGGWYLRGDIGFTNQSVQHLTNALESTLTSQRQTASFNSSGLFGLGVGYKYNTWLRGDITGEYRSSATLNGYETNTFSGGTIAGFNKYTGNKTEWLVLANAYADLGTWWCLTPFVGAGIGMANVTVSNFTDVGQTGGGGGPSSAYGDTASKWNFAWAAHAGVSYKVTPNVTMELAYRYVDLGDGITGDIRPYDGPGVIYNPTTLKHITSQDLKFGVRWSIDPMPTYAPPMLPPLIRKG